MRDNWVFITAGLGSSEFQAAAERLAEQSRKLYKWKNQITLTGENLELFCPTVSSKYKQILNSETKGFGYMCWKAEIVFRTMNNEFGPCDGIVWADAGCEGNANIISRFFLKRHLRNARKYGAEIFSLQTPEMYHSKRDLFIEFPDIDEHDITPQFQTTNFYLHGETGKNIALKWFEIVTKSQSMIDEATSLEGELDGFFAHRHDQSVFSLVCKSIHKYHEFLTITSGSGSHKALVRRLFSPFWATRNRTGISTIPKWLKQS